jgi:two-component system nitrogen regulation sensor histidine kinase GlnL
MLRTRVLRNVTIATNFYRLAASIEVIDNGPGIPENMIDTIFYPMISSRPEGTGLGLPITHGIINQHKGMIECGSKLGETKFTVVLPISESKN